MSVSKLNHTKPSVYELVPLDALTIDPRTQRQEGVNAARAAKIAEEWNPAAAGTLAVSRRHDGSLVCIDGAHRSAAARSLGIPELPALVYSGLTLAQEAALFVELNDFRSPSLLSRMLAGRVAGDPVATDVLNIIERHGWKISCSSDAGHFAAVAAAERVYRNGVGVLNPGAYPELLDRSMNLLTVAWRHDRESAHQMILLGIAQFLARFGDGVDVAAFALALAQERPYNIVAKAKGLQSAQGGTVPAALGKVLTGLYNKRRRTGLLPEWVWTR